MRLKPWHRIICTIILVMILSGFFGQKASAQCSGINFKASTTKGCPLLLVKFSAIGTSTSAGTSFKWDFGNGFVTGNDTITKAFTNSGPYTIRLQATLSGASTACPVITKDSFITVYPVPVPVITANPGFLDCNASPITFTDSTVGSVSRQWIINGKKDTTRSVKSYLQPGSYTINLFSTNKFGCQGYATQTEQVHSYLLMEMCDSFTVTPTYTKGEFVSQILINSENRKITNYSWSFPGGNPSSSTKASPSGIIYTDLSKRYDITLAVTADDGCTYSNTDESFVTSFVSLAFQTLCAGTKYPVTLYEPKIVPYNFLFPAAWMDLKQDTLAYYTPGNYSATVTIPVTTCSDIIHYPFYVKVLGPATSFTSDNNQICHSTDTVSLINTTDTLNAPNTNFTWYIFDSTDMNLLPTNNQIGPMTDFDTTYIPGRLGKFGVSLVATSSNGCNDTFNVPYFITVAKPKSNFDSINLPSCYGNTVHLVSLPTPSEGPHTNYSYTWSVINEAPQSQPDSSQVPFYDFDTDSMGVFDVSLVVSNGHCSSDTTKKAVFKIIGDITSVTIDNPDGCLNPTFTTVAHVNHEKKFPNDPNHPPLYRWWTLKTDTHFVHFLDSNANSTRIVITKSGCHQINLDIMTILDGDTCIQTYPTNTQKPAILCVGPSLGYVIDPPLPLRCPGDTVNVYNRSTYVTNGYKWKVIPANQAVILPSDTSTNIRIVFKTDTCYKIILSGTRDVNGTLCSNADTAFACITLPKPNFYTTTSTLYCAPAISTFVNTTVTPTLGNQYIWDFGDGKTLYNPGGSLPPGDSVSHVYSSFNKAEYDVSLTAINYLGCKTSIAKKAIINIIGPVPVFTMDKNTGCDSVTVHFTNTSSNVKKFYFSYDDGSPIDSINLAPHTYVLSDPSLDSIVYHPTLISLDDTSCRDYFQDSIKVYRASSDIKILSNILKGCVPLTVQFNATSKLANTWKWDFYGNGTINDSVDQNPVFTYTKPGIYRARLTVTNHGQCPVTVLSDTINVVPKAVAGFIPSVKNFCGGGQISFKNTSLNTVSFLFDYGDDSAIDTNTLASHLYFYDPKRDTGASVSFFPKLIAFNAAGCSDTLKDTIKIYRLPIAGFTNSATSGCNFLKVNFIDTSKNSFASEWFFDNKSSVDAFGKKVSFFYNPGSYTVKLRAVSLQNCVDSVVKLNLISVNAIPKTDFSVSDSDICYGDSVSFKNLTEPADSVVKWLWKFNDPGAPYDTSSAKNPVFVFYAKGWHNVTLIAIDKRGCGDTITKKAVFVEDTLPPQNTSLLYVSVIDEHTIQITYKKSALIRFESYGISQIANGVPVDTGEIKNISDTIFAYHSTAINTFNSSYCFGIQTENQCGKVSSISLPHCTILLAGYANPGPGNLLSWTAYSGWNPDWYYIYREDSSGSFKIIDSVKGNVLSWTDTALCDETYCYYVAAKNNIGPYLSNSNGICLKARYVRQTVALNLRYATVFNNSVVKIEWDTSAYKGLVGYQLGKYYPNKGWVDDYAFSSSNTYTDASAKINDSSYIYTVRTIDKCGYTGPESNIGTSIFLKQAINNDNVALSWNGYRNWLGGVQNYLVQVQLKNKQFKTIANLHGSDTTYTDDSVYNAIDTAYCYRVIAIENSTRADSSTSNLTCAVLPSRIFVPNAFSPNGDSINDVWKVSALSVYNVIGTKLTTFDAKVYNRWGTLVFESNNIYKGWDGTFKGENAPPDVYIYMIYAEGIDHKYISLKGYITLLR